MNCVDDKCKLSFKGDVDSPTLHEFAKKDLIDADLVRVHERKIVSVTGVKRKVAMTYGYSVQLKYKIPAEEGSRIKIQQSALLSAVDIGRRTARSTASQINNFIDGRDEVGEAWMYHTHTSASYYFMISYTTCRY